LRHEEISIFFFGTPNNDCANCRSFRRFPNLRQALFQAGSKPVLTAKSIFADIGRSLECTPQRRCGGMVDATDLKSVLAKAGYGFESHHRQPRKRNLTSENSLGPDDLVISNGHARKRTKTPSICQVFVKCPKRKMRPEEAIFADFLPLPCKLVGRGLTASG
jgi:hypothetical protein